MPKVYKMLYGSSRLNSDYAKDIDYLYIIDVEKLDNGEQTYFQKFIVNDVDMYFQTLNYTKDLMKGKNLKNSYKELCFLYLEMNKLDFPLKDIDWLSVEKIYKKELKDIILNDIKTQHKHVYTYFVLFKMWEYQDNSFRLEYKEAVDNLKLNRYKLDIYNYIEKELEVIHNE